MIEEGPKQQYVEIWPIPFQNILSTDDLINYYIENTGKILVALQHTPPLHSFVYQISEAKPSTPFN